MWILPDFILSDIKVAARIGCGDMETLCAAFRYSGGEHAGVDDPDEPHQSVGCDPAGLYTDSTGEGRVRMESDHASCHEKQPDPHCDTDRHYFCRRDRGCGGDGKYFRDTGRGRAADQCGEGPRRTDCDGHGYFCDNHCRHDQSGS